MSSGPDLTEKLRRREEKARRDRARLLQQQRERPGSGPRIDSGESPIGGRGNLRDRDR